MTLTLVNKVYLYIVMFYIVMYRVIDREININYTKISKNLFTLYKGIKKDYLSIFQYNLNWLRNVWSFLNMFLKN